MKKKKKNKKAQHLPPTSQTHGGLTPMGNWSHSFRHWDNGSNALWGSRIRCAPHACRAPQVSVGFTPPACEGDLRPQARSTSRPRYSVFFFITLGLELSDTKVYEP